MHAISGYRGNTATYTQTPTDRTDYNTLQNRAYVHLKAMV